MRIPFAVQHRPDQHLPQGKTVIGEAGQYGTRIKTIRELLQNGRVVRTVTVGIRRIKPSRPEIIDYGTAQPVSRGGTVPQFTEVIRMSATAYWPDPAWSSGYTYTGLKAQYGIAAVDPTVIPLGTHLYIPGYGFALAADIGGGIKGDRIDLCYDNLQGADSWGLREVNVYVLGPK
jgi:3D (Asp-Asp-Asp) domain-containing protein